MKINKDGWDWWRKNNNSHDSFARGKCKMVTMSQRRHIYKLSYHKEIWRECTAICCRLLLLLLFASRVISLTLYLHLSVHFYVCLSFLFARMAFEMNAMPTTEIKTFTAKHKKQIHNIQMNTEKLNNVCPFFSPYFSTICCCVIWWCSKNGTHLKSEPIHHRHRNRIQRN